MRYAANWILRAKDGDYADARWEAELSIREYLRVSMKDRSVLRGLIESKFGAKA